MDRTEFEASKPKTILQLEQRFGLAQYEFYAKLAKQEKKRRNNDPNYNPYANYENYFHPDFQTQTVEECLKEYFYEEFSKLFGTREEALATYVGLNQWYDDYADNIRDAFRAVFSPPLKEYILGT